MPSAVQGTCKWSPALRACHQTNTSEFKWSLLLRLTVDSVLLSIMIVGVLREPNATHLWNILFIQGLLWIIAAILAEVPCAVCVPCPQHSLVHWVDSPCSTVQVLPFININGKAIRTNFDCYDSFVKSNLQMLGIWLVVLHAFIHCL
jgi:hypothetical protein